jgi:predicted molibdopterin-dependent oxidoreductase YjgC
MQVIKRLAEVLNILLSLTHPSNGCGVDIGVKNNKVIGVRGRASDRVNKGRLGPKGLTGLVLPRHTQWRRLYLVARFSWKALHSKDRLTHPLVRKNGHLKQVSWDEAMNLIVAKSKELQQHLTNHSILLHQLPTSP